jgi:hypothetical protein
MAIAFLGMPWLSVNALVVQANITGLMLSQPQYGAGSVASILVLIPLAFIGGGLAALWGLADEPHRNWAAVGAFLFRTSGAGIMQRIFCAE